MSHELSTIEEALEDFKQGKILVVIDDEDRENEGDFICAAELCTPETMNVMIKYGSGFVCAPTTAERLHELNIPMMVEANSSRLGTAMTVTVDALAGTTTGVSAEDRSTTVRKLADPNARGRDFTKPGHIVPLRAARGGVQLPKVLLREKAFSIVYRAVCDLRTNLLHARCAAPVA